MSSGILIVRCPGCSKPVEWTVESTWRPFCSRRCQDDDFCGWANGEHVLDEGDTPDFFDASWSPIDQD